MKEATARIKLNRLRGAATWRVFDADDGSANIRLESNGTLTQADLDAFGNDFDSPAPAARAVERAIVAEFNAEKALVNAKSQLITHFEKEPDHARPLELRTQPGRRRRQGGHMSNLSFSHLYKDEVLRDRWETQLLAPKREDAMPTWHSRGTGTESDCA